MKRLIWIVIVLLLAVGSLAQPGRKWFWPSNTIIVDEKGKEGVSTLAIAIDQAASGDLIAVYPGLYTADGVSVTSGETIYIRGMHKEACQLSFTDTLFDGAGTLYLENLTLTATSTGNMFDMSTGLALHLNNCDLTSRFCDFRDSVWIDGCEFNAQAMDSMRFSTQFFEMENSRVNDYDVVFGWAAGDTAIGTITNCYVESDTTILHFANTLSHSNVKINGGNFISSSPNVYGIGIAGYTILEIMGASIRGGGSSGAGTATLYAHDTNNDSTLTPNITLASCNFYNPTNAGQVINIATADTVDISGCRGNEGVVIDSCETADINLGSPIVYWGASNYFDNATFSFGLANVKTKVIGPGDAAHNIVLSGLEYYSQLDNGTNTSNLLTIYYGGQNVKYVLAKDGQVTQFNPFTLASNLIMQAAARIIMTYDSSGTVNAIYMNNNAVTVEADSTVDHSP